MIEEAQEKPMDAVASLRTGKSITITKQQYHASLQSEMVNLLASSNRFGYIFYATETDDLVIIPSSYLDREFSHLSKSADDDDDENNQNENLESNSTFRRPYMPKQMMNKSTAWIPQWIALNADETILAVILWQQDANVRTIMFYDVVKLIQTPEPTPVCQPMQLKNDDIGGFILNFLWNPAIPNMFAFIDGQGSVATFEIDLNTKQVKSLGRCAPNDNYASICWSPKGKQLVVVSINGALECFDANMNSKKKYSSFTDHTSFPPCISVYWVSTYQYLLGFSENNPDENTPDNSFFYIMVTCDKDRIVKTQIYIDLFFDAEEAPAEADSQYYHATLDSNKVIICGLSKSLQINVLGLDELNQNYDIWTFDDRFRAMVKRSTNSSHNRPVLTGMTISLNSTLSIVDSTKKLPPAPMLLMSNSDGILQVYYFVHHDLSKLCCSPEVIKPNLALQTSNQTGSFANGFSFANNKPPVPKPATNGLHLNGQQPNISATTTILSSFPGQPVSSPMIDPPKSSNTIGLTTTTSIQPTVPNKTITVTSQQPTASPIPDQKILIQTVEELKTRLDAVRKPLSMPFDEPMNMDKTMTELKKMLTSIEECRSMKALNYEHIELMTRIENARHQIRLIRKENLQGLLKDRELDPWTQSRLESINEKYHKIKHNLNVLLRLMHKTIHDKSLSINENDSYDVENEDFLPDLELLDSAKTLRQSIQNRLYELSRKVIQADNDLQTLCKTLESTTLSNKSFDSDVSKSTTSSERPFHTFDSEILAHLRATRKEVPEVRVPSAPTLHLSSLGEENKSNVIETPKSMPSTVAQANSPTVDSEGFKNMLRFVQSSINFYSGVASPEQIREISDLFKSSPIQHRPDTTSADKTPTISKTQSHTKAPMTSRSSGVMTPSTNPLQSPAKTVTASVPNISVIPATPTNQTLPSDTSIKTQQAKTNIQPSTDQSVSQGDSTIRQLLSDKSPQTATLILNQNQPARTGLTTGATSKSTTLINTSAVSPSPVIVGNTALPNPSMSQLSFGNNSPVASTITTSVQLTTPTTKPITSTGTSLFGSKPLLGNTAFNSTSAAPSTNLFSSAAVTTNTGSLFGSASITTTSTPASGTITFDSASISTTAPATSTFGTTTTSTPTVSSGELSTSRTPVTASTVTTLSSGMLGSGFGVHSVTPTATTSSSNVFGGGFGTPTTSTATSSASGFGASSATPTATTSSSSVFGGGFGTPTTSSTTSSGGVFGSGFGTSSMAPTSSSNVFGGGFGTPTTSTATSSTSIFGSGFGASSATPTATTSSSSVFGSGFGTPTTSTATQSTGIFGSGFGTPPTSTAPSSSGTFGSSFGSPAAATTASSGIFGTGFGTPTSSTATTTSSAGTFSFSGFNISSAATATTSAAPNTNIFGSTKTSTPSGIGGIFSSPTSSTTTTPTPGIFGTTPSASATTTTPTTSIFGASATSGSPFGSTFGTTVSNATNPFGAAASNTGSIFGGASTNPTSTSSIGSFGQSGFSFTSAAPTSNAKTTPAFGATGSASVFGSSFSGFGTQSNPPTSTSGFSFGGFGGTQPADASKPIGFASFGGSTSTPTSSAFGSTSTASTSPSFTAYRK